MNAKASLALLIAFLFISVARSAVDDSTSERDDSSTEISYDAIVNDLHSQERAQSQVRVRAPKLNRASSSFDDILIHGGIAVSNMFGTLSFADGAKTYMNQRGVQASLGIDLLSPAWTAEGSARSFSDSEYARNGVSLKEFDLRLFYKSRLSDSVGARFGAGIAARYLTVDRGLLGIFDYVTPASVASVGIDAYLSPAFSMGIEASARTAMIADSVDQVSFDGAIRFDAHF